MNLKEVMQHQETALENKLSESRAKYTHTGIKGGILEAAFRDLLSQYLPKKLSVGTGQVVDSDSAISQQIDVVISTEYHPGILDRDEPSLYFVEGVCGAGEIKTRLTTDELKKSIRNCNSFKRLNPRPVKSLYSGSRSSNFRSPYFIFAMESAITGDKILETLEECEPAGPLPGPKLGPDIVFVKGKPLIVDPRGLESIHMETAEGKPIEEWATGPNFQNSLFDFLMLLIHVIPMDVHLSNFMQLYSGIGPKPRSDG